MRRQNPLIAGILLLVSAGSAAAQTDTGPSLLLQDSVGSDPAVASDAGIEPMTWTPYVVLSNQFRTDFEGSTAGSVSIARLLGGVEGIIPVFRGAVVEIHAATEWSRYDFKDLAVGGSPNRTDDMSGTYLGARYRMFFDEHWYGAVGAAFTMAAQSDAKFSDGLTYGFQAGGGYRFDDKLVLGLGFSTATELESDQSFFLFPIVKWKITDKWRFNAEPLGLRGVEFELSYYINDDWRLQTDLTLTQRTYRLDNTGIAPGGALRDTYIPLMVGATWTPEGTGIELIGRVGVQVYQEIRVRNSASVDVFKSQTDPAPMASLELRWTF